MINMPILDTSQLFPRTAHHIRRVIEGKHPGRQVVIHMRAGCDVIYSVK